MKIHSKASSTGMSDRDLKTIELHDSNHDSLRVAFSTLEKMRTFAPAVIYLLTPLKKLAMRYLNNDFNDSSDSRINHSHNDI